MYPPAVAPFVLQPYRRVCTGCAEPHLLISVGRKRSLSRKPYGACVQSIQAGVQPSSCPSPKHYLRLAIIYSVPVSCRLLLVLLAPLSAKTAVARYWNLVNTAFASPGRRNSTALSHVRQRRNAYTIRRDPSTHSFASEPVVQEEINIVFKLKTLLNFLAISQFKLV